MLRCIPLAFLLFGLVVCSPDIQEFECFLSSDCPNDHFCSSTNRCLRGSVADAGDIQVDELDSVENDGVLPDDADMQEEPDAELEVGVDGSGFSDTEAIFIDGEDGDDENTGTSDYPIKTLEEGLQRWKDHEAFHALVIAAGNYTLAGPLRFANRGQHLIISGCHQPSDDWSQSEPRDDCTVIMGATPVMEFDAIDNVSLYQVHIRAEAGRPGDDGSPVVETAYGEIDDGDTRDARSGENSIGIVARSCRVHLFDSIVETQDGGAGGAGRFGRNGADGGDGDKGDPSDSTGTRPSGGVGGTNTDCYGVFDAEALSGGDGGKGGNSSYGDDPERYGSDSPGEALGGLSGTNNDPNGQPGEVGGDAQLIGSSGGPFGYFREYQWHPVPGSRAGNGFNGTGGGGGAGGITVDVGTSHGSGGGGGGAGGCGGEGGGGGGGGGGSIGVILIDSTLQLTNSDIMTGKGGEGGPGGAGGLGGAGGAGAPPGSDPGNISTDEGAGGTGGAGGDGQTGGGGSGGASFAVLAIGDPLDGNLDDDLFVSDGESTYVVKEGGRGGDGADDDPEHQGPVGASEPFRHRNITTDDDGVCPHGSTGIQWEDDQPGYCVADYEASTESYPDLEGDEEVFQAFSIPGEFPAKKIIMTRAFGTCFHSGGLMCYDWMLEAACQEGADGLSTSACNFGDSLAVTGGPDNGCHTSTGIYDLWGNVAEWMFVPALSGVDRSTYGGSYLTDAANVTDCAFHEPENIYQQQDYIGFRCCFEPGQLDRTEFSAD